MSRARHHGEDFYIGCDCDHCTFMARKSCQCFQCRLSDEEVEQRQRRADYNEMLAQSRQAARRQTAEPGAWSRADSEALANAHAMRIRASGPAGIWLW